MITITREMCWAIMGAINVTDSEGISGVPKEVNVNTEQAEIELSS